MIKGHIMEIYKIIHGIGEDGERNCYPSFTILPPRNIEIYWQKTKGVKGLGLLQLESNLNQHPEPMLAKLGKFEEGSTEDHRGWQKDIQG